MVEVDDLGFALVDLDRGERQGLPEVVFAPGKTVSQIASILVSLRRKNGSSLATRVTAAQAGELVRLLPEGNWQSESRLFSLGDAMDLGRGMPVAVVSAGTADGAVAAEAAGVLRFFGAGVCEVKDAGVAGLHRLLDRMEEVRRARVVIVVAGMEAALPSVVAGQVAAPLIAVPVATDQERGWAGVPALLGMLHACVPGIATVNVDNGFGAAMHALRMAVMFQP
jgi:hypothetical protein